MATKVQQKARFDRLSTTDDQEEVKLPFSERLMKTREWLIKENAKGDVCWNDTIKAIESTLTDMGVSK